MLRYDRVRAITFDFYGTLFDDRDAAGDPARARPFPDAPPVVQALQRHFRIAIVSSVAPAALAAWNEALGTPLPIVTPETTGTFKPRPELFAAACAALGAPPDEVLHVGDDPDADAVGAWAAGLMAVWLNRDARPAPRDFPPGVVTLRSLRGLPPLLTIRPLPR